MQLCVSKNIPSLLKDVKRDLWKGVISVSRGRLFFEKGLLQKKALCAELCIQGIYNAGSYFFLHQKVSGVYSSSRG